MTQLKCKWNVDQEMNHQTVKNTFKNFNRSRNINDVSFIITVDAQIV